MPAAMLMLAAIGTGLVGLVFARAAVHKLVDFPAFRASLTEYRVLPQSVSAVAAVGLAAAEIVAVCALLLPATRGAGAALAGTLLCIYASAMAINLMRGRSRIDCGCGGPGQTLSWFLVARNLLLAAICGFIAASGAQGDLAAVEAIATLGCTVLLWLLLLAYEQILGNRAHALATDYSGFSEEQNP